MLEFALRVAGMYFLALIMIRLLGKRALGELGPFDFVIMTGVGDVVISVALDRSIPYYEGIVVLATLAVLEYTMGYVGLKSGRLSNLITGVPVVLIEDGKIIRKNLAREKFNIDDLMQELRRQGVRNIKDVEKGILESCGGFSVVLKPEKEAVSKEDLGIKIPAGDHLITTEQLSRAEIFARLDQPETNNPEPNLTDRIRNIEQQLQHISALLENRSDPNNSSH
ncbi:MAG TPA: DUF421 domain-containing protein [Syntrophomonadaceae bacterium]|jgi:uncharacterized membrane protein YcaP (DUF421 family)|nr:DUF421 domain-containing protein [Syntrophomonadaceae bacterium]